MRCWICSLALALIGCGGKPAPRETPPSDHAHHGDHAKHDHAKHGSHDHRDGMPHRFDNAEQWAKVFDDPTRDAWQQPDKVIAALELAPGMTVADVGAGPGYFSVRIAKQLAGGHVIATDIEPDMVRYLSERATRENWKNLKAQVTPPDDPQLPAGAVDRILVVDVWHHLGDRGPYAKKLASALKPGGFVAVVDFKLDATQGPPKEHRLAPEAIIADLAAAGLSAAVSPTALPEQYIVIARR